jgi:hypothetical protein
MVVRDLREKMVDHVSPDVVVDVVEPPVVPVKRGQASTQIAPCLVHTEAQSVSQWLHTGLGG